MTDYAQPLLFGTAIGSDVTDLQAATRLAEQSERHGLDIVTAADHPAQDAWTLLSWIAGRTDRIHLSPHAWTTSVHNPGVIARSAASLDLLSGGRLHLALGAGTAGPALAALTGLGVPRQAEHEAAEHEAAGLEEVVAIVRGIWDIDQSGPFRFAGRAHHVAGAQRGPTPAHRVPIHLGGQSPELLELIGREADGWVVPDGMTDFDELSKANERIDAAARRAGRDPREIRRILTITDDYATRVGAQRYVRELARLITGAGIATVLLATTDPAGLEDFAARVVPAVREAVTASRHQQGHIARAVAPSHVRARRRTGIDYDDIPASLVDDAVEPGDLAYGAVRSNHIRGGSPGLVLRPRDSAEVATALTWARTQPVPLSVRSGGHGFSGRSTNDGGIIIDLGYLREIDIVDAGSRRVRVEPGARWGEVAAALRPYGWALSSGDSGGVGVGGLATAGGIGFLSRAHGLTIDHVRAVEMVLASGEWIRASPDQHPELFWAMRGAGFAFGIVTAFEFEVDEVGDIGFAQLAYDVSNDVSGFLHRWGAAVEASPQDTTSFLIMGPPQGGRVVAQTMNVVASHDPETIVARLQPLADVAPLVGQQVVVTTYDAVVSAPARGGHQGMGEPAARSGLLEHITPEFAADAERLLRSGATYFFQIRALGGATAEVAADATAFSHRSAQFSVLAMAPSAPHIDREWTALRHHFNGMYLSFETGQHPDRLREAFPPETLRRLRELKGRYDPENVFRDNFNLMPAEDATSDGSAAERVMQHHPG